MGVDETGTSRWSTLQRPDCQLHVANTVINGEFFRITYSTAKISYVSTVCRCCTAKSSPLLDSSCRDSHRNLVLATWHAAPLFQTSRRIFCRASSGPSRPSCLAKTWYSSSTSSRVVMQLAKRS